MESQVNEAGVLDDMEIVVKCEKHVIDEVTATSVCNEVPAQESQQDVIVDCSPNSEEEDENSMLLEIESSKSQASEGNFNFLNC
jgi:glyceraldehyde-3-phosphate dehydrogenase/erythrose-4-phosphate dehydrogenase